MQRKGRISSHVREIDRCNQRGGRFLSIMDLIEAGTLDLELAAYLGAAILKGSSFLVGSVPGGAGKTTVMGALLNFVPPGVELCAATEGIPGAILSNKGPKRCLICHEIGQGPYFAYLWGEDVQDFFQLPSRGHMGATNLHADTIEEAREIICGGCGVPERDFSRWPLFLFLELEGSSFFKTKRRIGTVWEGPGRLVYRHDGKKREWVQKPKLGDPETRERVLGLLIELREEGKRGLEDVRRKVLQSFS